MNEDIIKNLDQETISSLVAMHKNGSLKHVVTAISALQYNSMLTMTDPAIVDKTNIEAEQRYFRGLMGIVELTEDMVNFKRKQELLEMGEDEDNFVPTSIKIPLMIQIKNKFTQFREFFKN